MGRPTYSKIRQNIVEILNHIKKGYGYQIYKIYKEIFPDVSMRSIYYHLNKGVQLEIFQINQVENEKGDYSWGDSAKKIYYSLGEKASPKGDTKVKEYIENMN